MTRSGAAAFSFACSGRRAACKSTKPQPTRLPLQKKIRHDRSARSHPDTATHATPTPNRHEQDSLSHIPISVRNFRRFAERDQKTQVATKTFDVVTGVSPARLRKLQPTRLPLRDFSLSTGHVLARVSRAKTRSRRGCFYRTFPSVWTCVKAEMSPAIHLILQPTSRVSVRQPTTRAGNPDPLEQKSERDPA